MVSCRDRDLWIGELEVRLNDLLAVQPKTDVGVNRAIESVTEALEILKDYPCEPKFEQMMYGPGGLEEGPRVLDFLVDELGQPGGIVLPGYPEKLPCRCVAFEGKDLCTRRGVIGTLTQAQNEQLCSTRERETDRRLERLRHFREAVNVCHPRIEAVPEGRERLLTWITCMGEELRARGVELR